MRTSLCSVLLLLLIAVTLSPRLAIAAPIRVDNGLGGVPVTHGPLAPKPQLPGWPQTLSLAAGGCVSYLIPVTSAGKVTLTVNWQGEALKLSIINSAGTVVASADNKTAPTATLSVDATAADVATGVLWAVSASTVAGMPEPRQSPTLQPKAIATGTLSATFPTPDPAAVTKALAQWQVQHDARAQDLLAQLQSRKKPTVKRPTTGVPTGSSTTDWGNIGNIVAGAAKKLTDAMAAFDTASKSALTDWGPFDPATLPQAPNRMNIMQVVPTAGGPGDTINVICCGFTDTKKQCFMFNFGTDEFVAPVVTGVKNFPNGWSRVTIIVTRQYPFAVRTTANTKLSMLDTTTNTRSNTQPFVYNVPAASPFIETVDPVNIVQQTLDSHQTFALHGKHLSSFSEVHFNIFGLGDKVGTNLQSDGNTHDIRVSVPPFRTAVPLDGQVYVIDHETGIRSGAVPIHLSPNQSSLDKIDPATAGLGDYLLLTGHNLAGVKWVACGPRPQAKQPNCPYMDGAAATQRSLTILKQCENAILVQVPSDIDGFSGPMLCDVTLPAFAKGDPNVGPYTLTLNPLIIDSQLYYTAEPDFSQFEQRDVNDFARRDDDPNWSFNYVNKGWVFAQHLNSGWFTCNSGYDIFSIKRDADHTWHPLPGSNWSVTGVTMEISDYHRGDAALDCWHLDANGFPVVGISWNIGVNPFENTYVDYHIIVHMRGPHGVPAYTDNNGKFLWAWQPPL